MKCLAFLLACLAASACSHAAPPASEPLAQLRALERDAACSSDQQCRSVALGAKSCGGPEAYMAYSTAKASADKVQALAERYRKEREAANKASGLVSDCRYLMDPGALCRAGRCQLGNGAAALE
ncbi:hypothetical protein [Pseudoduganella sp.]|uniref:hypothetical protein n=1 Tax=Pseudoduganella sp. TaxID=1880898 RepID=UPI0035AE4421